MTKQNPFTLGYGRLPYKVVDRTYYEEQIIADFTNSYPTSQSYLISGLRGSGKTVLLSSVANSFKKMDKWIVLDLNPERDLLNSLAARLYVVPELYAIFTQLKFNFSMLGFGVSFENQPPISDVEVAIEMMLEQAKKIGLNILITIDEVLSSQNIKTFASSFQIFVRNDYPIFLLMTGLPENIIDIINQDTLTFLYRSPRITLEPLALTDMEDAYSDIFEFKDDLIEEMALATKGYSYAFQVMGYTMWEAGVKSLEEVLPRFKRYLYRNAYDKIWSELSAKDRVLLAAVKRVPTKRQELLDHSGLKNNEVSVYRQRLLDKGLIISKTYGYLELTLPFFDDFIRDKEIW